MPNFRKFIENKKDLDEFLNYKEIEMKVILFSNEEDTLP